MDLLPFDDLPPEDGNEFLEYTSVQLELTGNLPQVGSKLPDFSKKTPRSQATHSRATYASFGSNGTTATVNAHGNIMQISRYFGGPRSGFFAVELKEAPQPYYVVARMEYLSDLTKQPDKGVQLQVKQFVKHPQKYQTAADETIKAEDIAKADENTNADENAATDNNTQPTMEWVQDRWTKFSFGTSGSSVQYFCQDGIVFQTYRFDSKGKFPEESNPLKLKLEADVTIRGLDFMVWYEQYDYYPGGEKLTRGPHGRSLIFHRNLVEHEAEGESDDRSVCLIITAFVNGTAQKIDELGGSYWLSLDKEAQRGLNESEICNITVAYRLQLVDRTAKRSWKSFLISASDVRRMGICLSDVVNNCASRVKFSVNPHLDFAMRRNLHHILSVCSVPVASLPADAASETSSETGNMREPIALTCGDLSGHRIASAASYFAFRFLTYMLRFVVDTSESEGEVGGGGWIEPQKQYTIRLKERILTTCLGHLTWLCKRVKAADNLFPPHLWATGEPIPPSWWLPAPLLADTPFQILKFRDLAAFNSSDPNALGYYTSLREDLRTRIKPWIETLRSRDKRGKFAFPRPPEDVDFYHDDSRSEGDEVEKEESTYHLGDHCWIYLALKYLADSGLTPVSSGNYLTDNNSSSHFFPDAARLSMLKRFTTVNTGPRERMLATRRSVSKSRFLFHAKDTVLFYAMKEKFFDTDESSKRQSKKNPKPMEEWKSTNEAWRRTVDAQQDYPENQKWNKRKTLWYALAIAVASTDKSINKLPVEDLLQKARDVLLYSSSANGLFPGLIHSSKEQQQPVPYDDEFDRDIYWHATFEIPCILWTFREICFGAVGARSSKNDPPEKKSTSSARTRFISFKERIDLKGLVELTDDWFYPLPRSLNFEEDVTKAAKSTHNRDSNTFSDPLGKAIIVDVPKSGRDSEGRRKGRVPIDLKAQEPLTNNDIVARLNKTRTVFDAKKRIIWLSQADKDTALICRQASPISEREKMSSFFDRHKKYEKHFFDSTTATLNEWETEIHLSFFYLANGKKGGAKRKVNGSRGCEDDAESTEHSTKSPRNSAKSTGDGIKSAPGGATGIPEPSEIKLEGTGKNSDVQATIARAAMGFRFVGDFFDRFWTCHFVPYHPHRQPEENGLSEICNFNLANPGKHKVPWQQRKVLELLLFNEMMKQMSGCADDILDWAQKTILFDRNMQSSERFRIGTMKIKATGGDNPLKTAFLHGKRLLNLGRSDTYFTIIERWQMCEQVLQAVVDDLKENLDRVEDWKRRKEDREPQQPRWTKNDERLYRPALTKLQVTQKRAIRDLEHSKTSLEDFQASLTGRLSSIREDMSFRGSESINLFTYVTVVFLPLGFATGIFSMSGAPDRTTLVNLVIMSAVALLVTVIALMNAKPLAAIIEPLLGISSLILKFIAYPLLYPVFRWVVLPLREGRKFAPSDESTASDTPTALKSAAGNKSHAEDITLAAFYRSLTSYRWISPVTKAHDDYKDLQKEKKRRHDNKKTEEV